MSEGYSELDILSDFQLHYFKDTYVKIISQLNIEKDNAWEDMDLKSLRNIEADNELISANKSVVSTKKHMYKMRRKLRYGPKSEYKKLNKNYEDSVSELNRKTEYAELCEKQAEISLNEFRAASIKYDTINLEIDKIWDQMIIEEKEILKKV